PVLGSEVDLAINRRSVQANDSGDLSHVAGRQERVVHVDETSLRADRVGGNHNNSMGAEQVGDKGAGRARGDRLVEGETRVRKEGTCQLARPTQQKRYSLHRSAATLVC